MIDDVIRGSGIFSHRPDGSLSREFVQLNESLFGEALTQALNRGEVAPKDVFKRFAFYPDHIFKWDESRGIYKEDVLRVKPVWLPFLKSIANRVDDTVSFFDGLTPFDPFAAAQVLASMPNDRIASIEESIVGALVSRLEPRFSFESDMAIYHLGTTRSRLAIAPLERLLDRPGYVFSEDNLIGNVCNALARLGGFDRLFHEITRPDGSVHCPSCIHKNLGYFADKRDLASFFFDKLLDGSILKYRETYYSGCSRGALYELFLPGFGGRNKLERRDDRDLFEAEHSERNFRRSVPDAFLYFIAKYGSVDLLERLANLAFCIEKPPAVEGIPDGWIETTAQETLERAPTPALEQLLERFCQKKNAIKGDVKEEFGFDSCCYGMYCVVDLRPRSVKDPTAFIHAAHGVLPNPLILDDNEQIESAGGQIRFLSRYGPGNTVQFGLSSSENPYLLERFIYRCKLQGLVIDPSFPCGEIKSMVRRSSPGGPDPKKLEGFPEKPLPYITEVWENEPVYHRFFLRARFAKSDPDDCMVFSPGDEKNPLFYLMGCSGKAEFESLVDKAPSKDQRVVPEYCMKIRKARTPEVRQFWLNLLTIHQRAIPATSLGVPYSPGGGLVV